MNAPVGPSSPGDAPDGAPFLAWRLPAWGLLEFSKVGDAGAISRAQLEYLARLALLAPSTHNTVPVRMRLEIGTDDAAVHFAIDRCAVLPQSDPVGRQATVSVGASIANAMLAARAYGMSPSLVIDEDAESRVKPAAASETTIVEVATLKLSRVAATGPRADATRWVEAMLHRKMVRAEYDERVKLDSALADELSRIARETAPGLVLHLITDAPTILALGKFQELADSTVINRATFARELADWLLENESDRDVGMRGREFGLSDAAASRFRAGLAGTGPLLPDETVAFAKSGNLGMRSSSAVAVITVARDDLAHRLAAGRAFEEMALRLSLDAYCVAMHAGITEVEAPNMALRGRLRTFARPTVVFRIGKPLHAEDGDRPHASRPALEKVLYRADA